MDSMIPAFGLTDDENRRVFSIDSHVVQVLREAGVRSRPVWREVWIGEARCVELSTRRHVFLVISAADLLSLTEEEIVARIRRELTEGSTLDFPGIH